MSPLCPTCGLRDTHGPACAQREIESLRAELEEMTRLRDVEVKQRNEQWERRKKAEKERDEAKASLYVATTRDLPQAKAYGEAMSTDLGKALAREERLASRLEVARKALAAAANSLVALGDAGLRDQPLLSELEQVRGYARNRASVAANALAAIAEERKK